MTVSKRFRKQVKQSGAQRMDIRGGTTRRSRQMARAKRNALWVFAGWGGAFLLSGLFWLWALAFSGTDVKPLALIGVSAGSLLIGAWRGAAAYRSQPRAPWFD